MTALEKFIRLEALGQWRETPNARPREVIVSFGDATLMLRDINDTPITHWSLQATQAIGRDESGTTYGTDPMAEETLLISDAEMIAAIETISAAQALLPKKRTKSPRWLWPAVAFAAIAAIIWYGPDLLRKQAAGSIPSAQAAEIGGAVLDQLIATQGPICKSPAADASIKVFLPRLFGENTVWSMQVLDLSGRPSASLPGGVILIDRSLLEHLVEPDELAGYVALEVARATGRAPLATLLADARLSVSLRLLMRGQLDQPTASQTARAILADPALPDQRYDQQAQETLVSAGISAKSFASALTRSGFDYARVQGFDAAVSDETTPVLNDQEWVALHDICE